MASENISFLIFTLFNYSWWSKYRAATHVRKKSKHLRKKYNRVFTTNTYFLIRSLQPDGVNFSFSNLDYFI